MSIKQHMLYLLGSISGIYLLVTLGVLYFTIIPAINRLELDFAEENIERISQALTYEVEVLDKINVDWGVWGPTKRFVSGDNPGYLERNLFNDALGSIEISLMAMFDVNDRLHWSSRIQLNSGEDVAPNQDLNQLLIDNALVGHKSKNSSISGIIQTNFAPMLVVSRPILDAGGTGPIAGTLILGRLLTEDLFVTLRERIGVDFSVYNVKNGTMPDEIRSALDRVSEPGAIDHQNLETYINSYSLIHDLAANPVLIVQARTPKRITGIGLQTLRIVVALIVAAIGLFLTAVWRSINKSLIAPLLVVQEHIQRIRKSNDLSLRTPIRRKDEWGTLADELDMLTHRLEMSRQESEEARRSAIAASSSKSDFLARMSHEIRTPMNGVMGMTQLLSVTELNEEQRQHTETIQQSANALLTIINDILDFSKIEAGKLELDRTDFDLPAAMNECVKLLGQQSHQKGIQLILNISTEVPAIVRGDTGRIRQIVINLLGNAIKFTNQGKVILCVNRIESDDQFCLIEFRIEDTGVGIHEKNQPQIFESFTQADESTTRKFGGTGLGLAICRQLVELMDGEIGLDSELGLGSAFWFRIPLLVVAEKKFIDPPNSPESSQQNLSSGLGLAQSRHGFDSIQVLVVEDNLVNQKVVTGFLKKLGYEVTIANNGREAVELFQSSTCDMILMDCHMPEMDGFEATRAIRSQELTRKMDKTPIIALTANAQASDRTACLDAGMDDFLSKPFAMDDLEKILSKNISL